MEGWDIRVIVPQPGDPRPLDILGARGGECNYVTPEADIDRFLQDPQACRCADGTLNTPAAEAVLWESDSPAQGENVRIKHVRTAWAWRPELSTTMPSSLPISRQRWPPTESFRIATTCRRGTWGSGGFRHGREGSGGARQTLILTATT